MQIVSRSDAQTSPLTFLRHINPPTLRRAFFSPLQPYHTRTIRTLDRLPSGTTRPLVLPLQSGDHLSFAHQLTHRNSYPPIPTLAGRLPDQLHAANALPETASLRQRLWTLRLSHPTRHGRPRQQFSLIPPSTRVQLINTFLHTILPRRTTTIDNLRYQLQNLQDFLRAQGTTLERMNEGDLTLYLAVKRQTNIPSSMTTLISNLSSITSKLGLALDVNTAALLSDIAASYRRETAISIRDVPALTDSEILTLLQRGTNKEAAAFLLAIKTCSRIDEVSRIRRESILTEPMTIDSIPHTLVICFWGAATKGTAERPFRIDATSCAAMSPAEYRIFARYPLPEQGHIFPNVTTESFGRLVSGILPRERRIELHHTAHLTKKKGFEMISAALREHKVTPLQIRLLMKHESSQTTVADYTLGYGNRRSCRDWMYGMNLPEASATIKIPMRL